MADQLTFEYTVRDRAGKTKSGTMSAANQKAVADRLRELGYAPVSIGEKKESLAQKEINIPGFGKKVSLADLAVFSRQFATMINSGLSLIRALNILAEQTENPKLAEVIGEVRSQVEQGRPLSTAMADHEVFPKLYIAMVRAGETAGLLDQVLLRVAATLEADVALRRKVKSAMTYPVVVLIMAVVLSSAMIIFIVPTFEGLFESLGGELPLPTQVLVMLSEGMRTFWYLFLLAPIAAWQGFKWARKQDNVRFFLDRMKLKLPVFGPLFHKVALSRFTRNLGSLLRAGVPILQALEISADTVNNGVMSNAINDVKAGVKEGESMATPLSKHAVFPPMTVQMIAVGEETGAIDEMLEKISDFYDQEVEATTEQLTALLEPVMIAVLGGIVGGMVIALYMPMFKIFDLVQ
ncbi:type II secretion system F family protein [Euzebya sp.]|uniref:type II secretion system F family protein n=1 Tax=Euzebya sp. TaxID=1971409 RepID=UPI00351370D9